MKPLTIGNLIRQRRLARGLTMPELATSAGIHRNTVANIEQGRVSPTASTLGMIAIALEVGVEDLIPRQRKPRSKVQP